MRNIKLTYPTLEPFFAVVIGMDLYPELSFDMFHKADRELGCFANNYA